MSPTETDRGPDEQAGSLTEHVARFIAATASDSIPPDVAALAKKSILDTLACGLSGSAAPGTRLIWRYLEGLGCGEGPASVIGADMRIAPRFAALANGTAMHADDFDDTYQATPDRAQGVHATAPVLAAVLALAERDGRSGRDVLAATVVGVEVCCRVFDAADPRHILWGYHSTGTSGMLGAAGGVAHLLGQDVPTIRRTLGIAATQTGTLSAHHGTMTKPLHGGLAPECAVFAADLAGMDFTASPIALEGHWGFFHALGGGHDDERIRGRLGNPWTFVERGQWLKPWPTGSLGHPALTKMTELVHAHDLKPGEVNAIRVRIGESIRDVLSHDHPSSALEAKFGLPFPLAVILIEGGLGLAHFDDALVNRGDVREAMGKVSIGTYAPAEAREGNFTLVTAFLEIDLADGRTIGGRIDYHKGTLANPMTDDEVAEKMRECAAFARWPEAKTAEVIALVGRLDELDGVGGLMGALAPDG